MSVFEEIAKRFSANPSEQIEKLKDVGDQSLDEQELISFVKNKVDEARTQAGRAAAEAQWMTNVAYLLGFDGIFFDSRTKQYLSNNGAVGALARNRIYVNKILPTIQNRLARLAKNPPRYDVRPESSSSEDKDAARLGIEILNDIWDRQNINEKRLEMLMMMQQAGHAYFKVSWDPTLGKPIIDPETQSAQGFEGDVRVDAVSPFEIYADPLAKRFEDCQWITQCKVRKLKYFRDTYPDRGGLVKEEDAWLLSAQYEMRINSLNSSNSYTTGQEQTLKDAAIEIAYYEKRSLKHPNGRFVVVANGVLLHDGELPVGEIPFAKFDDIKIGGKYMAESVITHLRPMQDQMTTLLTKRAQWVRKLLAGKYIAPKGHGMSQESLNDQSGEILEFNPVPGAPVPQAVQVPMIPQYAYNEEDRLNSQIYDVSGITEISRGQLPSAGMPAYGMQLLQEQDETRLGVILESHEYSYAKIGTLILKYVQKFYKSPRYFKIAGTGLSYSVKKFIGSDLKNNHDVIVIKGSTIPNSKVLKRQDIFNAFNSGILGDQNDPKLRMKLLSMMEFGDVAEGWQEYALVQQQIQEHLALIKKGIVPFIHELDKHAWHLESLNNFRISDDFKLLSEEGKAALEVTIQEHLDWIVKLMNPGLDVQTEMQNEMNQQVQQLNAVPPEEAAAELGAQGAIQ